MKEYTIEELKKLIESKKYLFHITNKIGMAGIISTGKIKAKTFCGYREMYGLNEKKTASFTSDPIDILEDSCAEINFENKTIVLIFDREPLIKQGVFEVIYVSDNIFKKYINDYKYMLEDVDMEHEWRKLDDVDISNCIIGFCKYKSAWN